jgi:hypothetical protein
VTSYGRGTPIPLIHTLGEDIATFAETHTHRRGGVTVRKVWLRTPDPAQQPQRPPGIKDTTWQWLCETERRWHTVRAELGDQADALALALVRSGCGELQTGFERELQWPPAKWIPHPQLQAQRAEQLAANADGQRQALRQADKLARSIEGEWPGLARALRGTRHRQWLIWVTEDLIAGRAHGGPRAFIQHHTGSTKTKDTLVKDLLEAGIEAEALDALGISRSPYIGLGGPVIARTRGRALDITGWPGPLDLRVPPNKPLTITVNDGVTTMAVIENRQAAETVCDTHPDVAVIWCHGQPPRPVLDLIAEVAAQVDQVLVCPDADLGGVLIADRIIEALPPGAVWSVLDAGEEEHPRGEPFGATARTGLETRAARQDAIGALARACLARGYVVEQEAPARTAILHALERIGTPCSATAGP